MLEGITVPDGLSSQASRRAPSRQLNGQTNRVNKTGQTKTPAPCGTGAIGGSYRDRTDDIHGVNVALYQLS